MPHSATRTCALLQVRQILWYAKYRTTPVRTVYSIASQWHTAQDFAMMRFIQGGHKPGKPGILRDFSEHGKLRNFSGNSVQLWGKIVANKVFLVRHSNIWSECYIAGVYVEWPLMKVIVTFTFCCDNLWKSKFMALEKPGNSGNFFSYFISK